MSIFRPIPSLVMDVRQVFQGLDVAVQLRKAVTIAIRYLETFLTQDITQDNSIYFFENNVKL